MALRVFIALAVTTKAILMGGVFVPLLMAAEPFWHQLVLTIVSALISGVIAILTALIIRRDIGAPVRHIAKKLDVNRRAEDEGTLR